MMYVVIFKARIADFDEEYFRTAAKLKELAFSKYGCVHFVSAIEGKQEIAISHWHSEQQIRDWKNDPLHLRAQKNSRHKWYESYSVEICKVKRSYSMAE